MTFRSCIAAVLCALASPLPLAAPSAAHDLTLTLPRPLPPTRFTHGARRLELSRDGVMGLFRDGFNRHWALDAPQVWPRGTLPPLHRHPEIIPLPVPIPLPPLSDVPGTGMPRDPSAKLVMECQIVGTPRELPNDIRITNPYGFATEFGMRVRYSAPLGTEGHVDLPALKPDESAYLLDVLPRGMSPGTVCTAVQD